MTSPRDDAHEAAGLASLAIQEVQYAIREAIEKCQTALNAVHHAVGNSPMESAANAVNYLADARQKLEENIGTLEVAKDELRRFRDGF